MTKMIMKCKEISKNLIAYIKNELPTAESNEIKAHISSCRECSLELNRLQVAFDDIKNLPACNYAVDLSLINELANKKAASRIKPMMLQLFAAVGAAAVIFAIIFFTGNMSNKNIARQHPDKKDRIAVNIPEDNKVVNPDKTSDKKNSSTPVIGKVKINSRVIRTTGKSLIRKKNKSRILKPVSNNYPVNSMKTIDTSEYGITTDAESQIAMYVDTLAMCMSRSGKSRQAITCSVVPITTVDESDASVADTVTASILYSMRDRHTVIDVNRMQPSDSKIDSESVIREAGRQSGDYLIAGRIEKSKSGYLLSLYAVDKRDNSVIFNGDHPILLTDEMMPAV